MLLNLPSKGSDFIVLLLNDAVEPFALLCKNADFVFSFIIDSFIIDLQLLNAFLHLLRFCNH